LKFGGTQTGANCARFCFSPRSAFESALEKLNSRDRCNAELRSMLMNCRDTDFHEFSSVGASLVE
jgi:hypothetical protein